MGKREGKATRTARTIQRSRAMSARRQRARTPRVDVAKYQAIVDALPGTLTDRERADAEAALAIAPDDPQGTLL